MKKYTQKWKSLNKNGLKLSLVYGLNGLIKFVLIAQFFIFSALFLGLLTHYIPQHLRGLTMDILTLIVIVKCFIDFLYTALSQNFKRIKAMFISLIFYFVLLAGNAYIKKHVMTEHLVNQLSLFWLISFVLAALATVIQPILFKHYLFKNVINKAYLGIRKMTDALPPEPNLFKDADEKDANKCMQVINQNVIKKPYQDVVELSFLNKKVVTDVRVECISSIKVGQRTFIDKDTFYDPVFIVFPFGKQYAFYYKLIAFRLSRRAAFTATGTRPIKK